MLLPCVCVQIVKSPVELCRYTGLSYALLLKYATKIKALRFNVYQHLQLHDGGPSLRLYDSSDVHL